MKKKPGARTPFLQKLSTQHELFCLELVKRGRMRLLESYNAAGFAGQSAQSAHRLANDPLVAARVAELLAEKFRALHMEADEILARAAMVARSDARALFDESGALRPLHGLDEEAAASIAGVETVEEFNGARKDRVKTGEVRKVRLRDPMPALRLLAEHKRLVKAPEEGLNALAQAFADRLKEARQRKRIQPKEQKP